LLGFLPFNFHPARIFMGRLGRTFLGYALGAMTALGTMKKHRHIALLIRSRPERAHRRYGQRSGPFAPGAASGFYRADKEHVHHLLISMGFSPQGAVTFL